MNRHSGQIRWPRLRLNLKSGTLWKFGENQSQGFAKRHVGSRGSATKDTFYVVPPPIHSLSVPIIRNLPTQSNIRVRGGSISPRRKHLAEAEESRRGEIILPLTAHPPPAPESCLVPVKKKTAYRYHGMVSQGESHTYRQVRVQ